MAENINLDKFEEMREMWNNLNTRLSAIEEENQRLAREITANKYKTARERLIRKYSVFIILGTIMLAYVFFFIYLNPVVLEKYRLVTTIYWIVFFLFEISVDFYLMYRLKRLDIYNSSVSEIAEMAHSNWKIHKIAIAIGLPLAIGAAILMALAMDADQFVIIGMIVGGLVGLAIGIRQLLKFMNYYRMMRSE